jgi:hypothetical protein
VLRELLEENEGLQERLRVSLEAAARQEAAAAVQLQVERDSAVRVSTHIDSLRLIAADEEASLVSQLKLKIQSLESQISFFSSVHHHENQQLQQSLARSQSDVSELQSRLARSSQQLSDVQLSRDHLAVCHDDFKDALDNFAAENDRLVFDCDAFAFAGLTQIERIAKLYAMQAEHHLLLVALRRFWHAVGVLPSLKSLSAEDHGIIFEAVVALHSYLSATRLFDSKALPCVPASQQTFDALPDRMGILADLTTASEKSHYRSKMKSNSVGMHESPQRRSFFRSIFQSQRQLTKAAASRET